MYDCPGWLEIMEEDEGLPERPNRGKNLITYGKEGRRELERRRRAEERRRRAEERKRAAEERERAAANIPTLNQEEWQHGSGTAALLGSKGVTSKQNKPADLSRSSDHGIIDVEELVSNEAEPADLELPATYHTPVPRTTDRQGPDPSVSNLMTPPSTRGRGKANRPPLETYGGVNTQLGHSPAAIAYRKRHPRPEPSTAEELAMWDALLEVPDISNGASEAAIGEPPRKKRGKENKPPLKTYGKAKKPRGLDAAAPRRSKRLTSKQNKPADLSRSSHRDIIDVEELVSNEAEPADLELPATHHTPVPRTTDRQSSDPSISNLMTPPSTRGRVKAKRLPLETYGGVKKQLGHSPATIAYGKRHPRPEPSTADELAVFDLPDSSSDANEAAVGEPPRNKRGKENRPPLKTFGKANRRHGFHATAPRGSKGVASANVKPPSADFSRPSHGDAIDAEELEANEVEPAAPVFSATLPPPAPRTPDPHTPGPTTKDPVTNTPSTVRYRNELATEKSNMVARIIVEARGVSRKEIMRDEFVKKYIPSHSPAEGDMPAPATTVFTEGTAEGKVIPKIMRMLHLSLRALNDTHRLPFPLRSHIESHQGLNRCHGPLTKPYIALVRTGGPNSEPDPTLHFKEGRPCWTDVHFLVEHTVARSKDGRQDKQMQFAQNAWQVFAHQPSRERLFGLVVMDEKVCWCYTDHGSIVYSEFFSPDEQLATELMTVLSQQRLVIGNDYKVDYRVRGKDVLQTIYLTPNHIIHESEVIYYRPCLIGRSSRVSTLSGEQDGRILKSAWEQTTANNEAEVYDNLEKRGVRGVLKKYWSKSQIITEDVPYGKPAFPFASDGPLQATVKQYMSSPKHILSTLTGDKSGPDRLVQIQRRQTQLILSRCDDLVDFSTPLSEKEISSIFRDAMLCYYEVWKIGGYIQADITPSNIMRARASTKFSHNSERKVTIVDFNLSYDENDSGQEQRSGTPPFMAYALFDSDALLGRRIGHDLESFLYVLVYVFTFQRDKNEWRKTPFAKLWTTSQNALREKKLGLFGISREFETKIFRNFYPQYQTNTVLQCMLEWRNCIFGNGEHPLPLNLQTRNEAHENAFKACLIALDHLVGDDSGAEALEEIRQRAPNHNAD